MGKRAKKGGVFVTVKKKLIILNILMIGVPVLLVAVLAIAALNTWGRRYISPILEMYNADGGVYSVQNTLYAWKSELGCALEQAMGKGRAGRGMEAGRGRGKHGMMRKYAHDEDDHDDDHDDEVIKNLDLSDDPRLAELARVLAEMDYRLQVAYDDRIVYSNLTEADRRCWADRFAGKKGNKGSFAVGDRQGSIVRNSFEVEDEDCVVTAVRVGGGGESGGVRSYFQRYIVTFGGVFLACILLTVALTNLVLSGCISRMILRPLSILRDGAREIADGNLDFRLSCEGGDEFAAVCREFEAMRGRLKDSVDARLRYEASRREMLAGISHDLRTPLTSVKGYVEGLQDGVADTDEKRARYLGAIHRRALDMEALVDSLSVLARLENEGFRCRLERVNLAEWLGRMVEELREEAERKRVTLSLEDRCPGAEVLLDLQEMRRVLVNLMENSAKYRRGEEAHFRLTVSAAGEGVEIEAADDGPGVRSEDLPHLFESFYRGDRARTEPGSGLGLAIVNRIVEGHGGRISARNVPDGGLAVTLWLPSAKAAEAAKAKGGEPVSHAEDTGGGGR